MRKYGNAGERGGQGGRRRTKSFAYDTNKLANKNTRLDNLCKLRSDFETFRGWGRGRLFLCLFLVCFFPDSIDFFF